MTETQVPYWDVYPKSIKVTQGEMQVVVPLSVRGNPGGTPVFESVQPWIADVSPNGRVILGNSEGCTMILVYGSEERQSIRYVQVEVVANTSVPA